MVHTIKEGDSHQSAERCALIDGATWSTATTAASSKGASRPPANTPNLAKAVWVSAFRRSAKVERLTAGFHRAGTDRPCRAGSNRYPERRGT